MWNKVMEGEGVCQQDLCDRYDLVLHFKSFEFESRHQEVTMSPLAWLLQALYEIGPMLHFKTGETTDDNGVPVVRTSTPDQARDKDKKAAAAWKGHDNVHIVESAENFTDKVAVAIEIMRQQFENRKKSKASAPLSAAVSGRVTMHPALSLVILLMDETGAPMTTEKALSIVDVDFFKQLTGFTQDKGWEMRMATPPLWGGKPVERHLTILSPLETTTLIAFYSSIYPHNPAGGFVYSDLSDSVQGDEIRKQYDEGKFLALDGTFQPFLNAGKFPVARGKGGEPVFKMALHAAMTKAVEKLGHPSCIQFVADDTILLELATCTFLESLATKALAIGIDEKTKSYCRNFRGAMGLRPDFPKTEYTLEVKVGVGAMCWPLESNPARLQ